MLDHGALNLGSPRRNYEKAKGFVKMSHFLAVDASTLVYEIKKQMALLPSRKRFLPSNPDWKIAPSVERATLASVHDTEKVKELKTIMKLLNIAFNRTNELLFTPCVT